MISGMALGIDAAAHRAALFESGGTVAVIGTGADRVYPACHHDLARQIAEHGAIVSEWPLGSPARAAHFPQRNRLIAALSSGVVVIEAALRSGSLITARLGAELGRDVFALPGSIHAPQARGCHRLIQEGARLSNTPEEILEESGLLQQTGRCRFQAPSATAGGRQPEWEAETDFKLDLRADSSLDLNSNLNSDSISNLSSNSGSTLAADSDACAILDALAYDTAHLETLQRRTHLDSGVLQAALFRLELRGLIAPLPGGWFERVHHGSGEA